MAVNNNNQALYNSLNPLSYLGSNPSSPSQFIMRSYPPTANDSNMLIGTVWLNFGQSNPNASNVYMLVSKSGGTGVWAQFGTLVTINGLTPSEGNIVINAGQGIAVSSEDNTITISDGTWVEVPSAVTTVALATNTNYTLENTTGSATLTLPTSSNVGDKIMIIQTASGGAFTIAQNANQEIFAGSSHTTSGATGYVGCTGTRNVIEIICTTANLTWQVVNSIGTTSYN
jgi:hypothetical protein